MFVSIIFGALYLREGTYRDLWANLLAAVIAVLLIDFLIIRQSEFRESKRSRNYARLSVFHACLGVLRQMDAPRSWKEDLEKCDRQWYERYKQRILTARQMAIDRFERILERYSYLLDTELQNDIFDVLTVMGTFYDVIEMFSDFDERTKYDSLFNMANLAAASLNQSTNIIRTHRLLESSSFALSYRQGEPPKLTHDTVKLSKSNISNFEAIVENAVKFKDRCQEKFWETQSAR